MASGRSVTHWIGALQAGDHEAAEKLWQRYFRRLVGLARKKLRGLPRRAVDEEDVALSAFDSFCRGAEAGRFPLLRDRNNLWRLLVTITARKALKVQRDQGRRKRGGSAVHGGSAPQALPNPSATELEQIAGPEPTPAFAAEVADECRRLLERLADAELRSIAQWKMEGDSNEDIAARLGCALSTVERRLRLSRHLWQNESAA